MKPSYHELAQKIEAFTAGDDEALTWLTQVDVEWTPVYSERLVRRTYAAFGARLTQLQDLFLKDLALSGGQVFAFERSLASYKLRFAKLEQFIRLPWFPAEMKNTLAAELIRLAGEIEKGVRESCRAQPTLALKVRGFRLLEPDAGTISTPTNATTDSPAPAGFLRRKIGV